MTKRDVKKALGTSLKAEEQAVKSRFEKAEIVLGKQKSPAPQVESKPNGASKVIRDSFTMPDGEYELISRIKHRCMKVGISANKSEVLRAGLVALNAMQDKELTRVFGELARVKTGRPPGKK